MKNYPLVSIILPVHNSERFLISCLESIKRQTYTNIEIIAIDDNSKDNSFKILKKFNKEDKRFRVYKNIKKYGFATTLNRAIKRTRGQFIAFMGASDMNFSNRIKKQVNFLLSNPKTVVLGAQCVFTDYNNKKLDKSHFPTGHESIYQTIFGGFSMQFETVMINKFLLPKDLLKFKENTYPFFYIDFLMKLFPYGEFANLSDLLYYHRKFIEDAGQKIKFTLSLLKLWLKSLIEYEYRIPLRTFFHPLVKYTK